MLEPIIFNHRGYWSIGVLRRNWRTPIGLVFNEGYRRIPAPYSGFPFRKKTTAAKRWLKMMLLALVQISPVIRAPKIPSSLFLRVILSMFGKVEQWPAEAVDHCGGHIFCLTRPPLCPR